MNLRNLSKNNALLALKNKRLIKYFINLIVFFQLITITKIKIFRNCNSLKLNVKLLPIRWTCEAMSHLINLIKTNGF